MRKCPRCNHEIKANQKYCPHCGLDLQVKYHSLNKKKNPMNFLFYLFVSISLITIPFLYSEMLDNISDDITLQTENNLILEDIKQDEPTTVIQTFDTLADFKQKYTNVSTYISQIQDYEKTLDNQGIIFNKSYLIQVLDNNNFLVKLTYTAQINNDYEIEITKQFDRGHLVNLEDVSIKKKGVSSFEELLLNEDEMNLVNQYVDDITELQNLQNEFSLRKDEFNEKKEKLGHYGLGTYHESSSFIVYRYDNTFTSVLSFENNPTQFII